MLQGSQIAPREHQEFLPGLSLSSTNLHSIVVSHFTRRFRLQMDRSFETIINSFFYLLLFWIFLGILGVNPYVLWGTMISFMISFKFMIGTVRLLNILDLQTEENC
jgi:hypothetical protein